MLTEYKKYHYSKRGKISQEGFLRNGLVNDYLQKSYNKEYFKQHISDNPSVDITFHPEETMTYIDSEGDLPSTDYIDISIWESDLQSIWSEKTEDEIKFAIECKRIENLSDTKKYVSDIDNFCNRHYVNTRLPFEGQIAFIENQSIDHSKLRDKINTTLQNHDSIVTNVFLDKIVLNDKFDGTYLSKHQRNTSKRDFSIYHLLLNYSNIVIQ